MQMATRARARTQQLHPSLRSRAAGLILATTPRGPVPTREAQRRPAEQRRYTESCHVRTRGAARALFARSTPEQRRRARMSTPARVPRSTPPCEGRASQLSQSLLQWASSPPARRPPSSHATPAPRAGAVATLPPRPQTTVARATPFPPFPPGPARCPAGARLRATARPRLAPKRPRAAPPRRPHPRPRAPLPQFAASSSSGTVQLALLFTVPLLL